MKAECTHPCGPAGASVVTRKRRERPTSLYCGRLAQDSSAGIASTTWAGDRGGDYFFLEKLASLPSTTFNKSFYLISYINYRNLRKNSSCDMAPTITSVGLGCLPGLYGLSLRPANAILIMLSRFPASTGNSGNFSNPMALATLSAIIHDTPTTALISGRSLSNLATSLSDSFTACKPHRDCSGQFNSMILSATTTLTSPPVPAPIVNSQGELVIHPSICPAVNS